MNSKAILIGVNLAASLPLLVSQQAQAANGQDTASFLKSVVAEKATARSLGDSQPTLVARALPSRRDYSASSLSSPSAVAARNAMSPVAGTVKLRPFVPGRKLPSRSQLESRLAAQVPQMDVAPTSANLSGNISETGFIPQADSSYSSPGYSAYTAQQLKQSQGRSRMRQAAEMMANYQRRQNTRSMPGQMPSTPGQVGFPCAPQAVSDMRRQAEPSADDWAQMARNNEVPPQVAAQARAQFSQPSAQSLANDPEMASLEQEFMASKGAPTGGTAGPAPFPLSLLPEASLKQLIGSSAKPAGAARSRQMQGCAPSYFGSWHAGAPIAAAKPGLAPAGFHTYLTNHGSGKVLTSSAFKSYAPMAYSRKRQAPVQQVHASQPATVHKNVVSMPVVATYGAYHAAPL